MDPAALEYLPLAAVVGVVAGATGFARWRAGAADERLVQLRGRTAPDRGGQLALAGLGFALAVAVILFAPTAAVCLSSETCLDGPALWVSAAGLALLALAAAIAWPALTRNP